MTSRQEEEFRARQVENCERVVTILLQAGTDPDMERSDWGIALHVAAFIGNEVIVSELLDAGADVRLWRLVGDAAVRGG